MSSEASPSGIRPTDDKGKRKRPESPSQDPESKKSGDIKPPQRQSARIESLKQGKANPLDLGDISPKGSLSQHPQSHMESHGASPWPTEASAPNHPDQTFDDFGDFRKFLCDSRDEAKLAVYLGLQHKHDLRHFALSWPVIKTWIRAPYKQTNSLKDQINLIIYGSKELACIEDPHEIWPQRPRESEERASLRVAHIMAWYLVQMSKDIGEYIGSSDLDNFHRTRRYRGELSAILELDIPLDNIFHPRPQLVTWRNELSDKFNRCWAILGYVSWIPYLKSWETALGFFASSKSKAIIYDSGIPTKPKPRPNHLTLSQQCPISSLERRIKAPIPLQVKVAWDRNDNTHRNMNLCRVLTAVARDGKVLPQRDQMMTQDPRACRTGASFRDLIRHMMCCGGYGLNLCDMKLSYCAETENCYYEIDAFRTQWKVLQGIFSDAANSNFVIWVLLDVHDYRNGEIYETTELPPVY
ncbi:hypothetical protein Pdw03_7870 [Penicillium digitatum]|nr:hypothetical protein Pdw03_7870 [Penicillium digitatum]